MGTPWFGVKRYGIGLGPKGPGGWIALLVYVVAMSATGPIVQWFAAPLWTIGLVFAVLTIGFIVLAFIKSDGQPWRWRWGDQ